MAVRWNENRQEWETVPEGVKALEQKPKSVRISAKHHRMLQHLTNLDYTPEEIDFEWVGEGTRPSMQAVVEALIERQHEQSGAADYFGRE